MSSTNRSNARKDHIADYYITPVKDIVNFMNHLDNAVTLDFSEGNIVLDPCAGGDENHGMSYPTALKEYYALQDGDIKTMDIRDDSRAETIADYLNTELDYEPSCIISNPPFNRALEFIQKALQDVKVGGVCHYVASPQFLRN